MTTAPLVAKQIPVATPEEVWDEVGWLPCLVSVDLPLRSFTVRTLLQLEPGIHEGRGVGQKLQGRHQLKEGLFPLTHLASVVGYHRSHSPCRRESLFSRPTILPTTQTVSVRCQGAAFPTTRTAT